ncbi:MAG TPA: hypothetical protein VJ941_03965, partial [Gracilimonas sp.]|nr:hypothetical protein [Gracilimonas sp.]
KKHRSELEKLAETLLEKEVLDHHALRELLGDRPHGKYPDGIFEKKDSKSSKNGVANEVSDDKKQAEEEATDAEILNEVNSPEEDKASTEEEKE